MAWKFLFHSKCRKALFSESLGILLMLMLTLWENHLTENLVKPLMESILASCQSSDFQRSTPWSCLYWCPIAHPSSKQSERAATLLCSASKEAFSLAHENPQAQVRQYPTKRERKGRSHTLKSPSLGMICSLGILYSPSPPPAPHPPPAQLSPKECSSNLSWTPSSQPFYSLSNSLLSF